MKSALLSFSGSLAKSLPGTRVTSNVITCGIIMSPPLARTVAKIAEGMGGDFAAAERHMATVLQPTIAQRLGTPDEVGNLAAYLCSPLADYITGANIRLDGGMMGHISL